jgi:hypothetical protein
MKVSSPAPKGKTVDAPWRRKGRLDASPHWTDALSVYRLAVSLEPYRQLVTFKASIA